MHATFFCIMNAIEKEILALLHIREEELPFLLKEPQVSDLEDPYNFLNMEKAVERIRSAVSKSEKIMIYGDYDCDGISAVSVMVKMFQSLGCRVGYYIPSRYIDGYGITLQRAEQIHAKGYTLVITVDNGVAAYEPIRYLSESGIDVILTDHHAITRELPPCYCVVHPDLKREPTIKQCGAYVAFMMSVALLGRVDAYLLTMAAVATVSDMMPLRGENRTILKLGLDCLKRHMEYPHHLLVKPGEDIDEEALAFTVCPKINAYGRIREDLSVNDMVRFFVTDDPSVRKGLQSEIERTNLMRKSVLSEALSTVDFSRYADEKVIVECFENVSEGVIGLIAARVMNECGKPCIALAEIPGKEILKGSARSLEGFSLEDAFTELSEYLSAYGGHALAGGLSLKKSDFEAFRLAVHRYAEDKEIAPAEERCIDCAYSDLTGELFRFLLSLAPYGTDFPMPRFRIRIPRNLIHLTGASMNHINGRLTPLCTFVGFHMAAKLGEKDLIAVGTLSKDHYRKGEAFVFRIEKVMNSD